MAQGPMVVIQILSWILAHFPGFFTISRWGIMCISAGYERIAVKFFGGVGSGPKTNHLDFGGNPMTHSHRLSQFLPCNEFSVG